MRGDGNQIKLDFIVATMSDGYFSDENFALFSEIILTENTDLIASLTKDLFTSNNLKIKDNFKNYYFNNNLKTIFKDVEYLPELNMIIDCLVKVYGRITIFKQSCLFYHKFSVLREHLSEINFANLILEQIESMYYNKLEFAYKINCFGALYQELIPEFKLDLDSEDFIIKTTAFNQKSILLSLMINDEELVEKFDVVDTLEKVLADKLPIDKFNQFDPYSNTNITEIAGFFDDLPYGYVTDALPFFIFGKSEFLDKFAFICFYMRTYTPSFDVIGVRYIKNDYQIYAGKEEQIFEFFDQFPLHKIPLYLSMIEVTFDRVKACNTVTCEELIAYFKSITLFENLHDFIFGKTDVCNFVFHYTEKKVGVMHHYNDFSLNLVDIYFGNYINFKEITLFELYSNYEVFKKLIRFSSIFDKSLNKDIVSRLKVIYPLFNVKFKELDLESYFENDFEKYEYTTTYLFALNHRFETHFKHPQDNLFLFKYYFKKWFNDMVQIFASNQEWVDFTTKNYKNLSLVTKAILLRVISTNIDKNYDNFTRLSDTTNDMQPLFEAVYTENPELVTLLLKLLSSKKVGERKFAFKLLTTHYPNQFLSEISATLEVEKNAKFKEELAYYMATKNFENESCGGENLVADLLEKSWIIDFIKVENFTPILVNSGCEAELDLVKASLIAYATNCTDFTADFETNSLSIFCKELLEFYTQLPFKEEQKWVVGFCYYYAGFDNLFEFMIQYIKTSSNNNIVYVFLEALTIFDRYETWLALDGFGRKHKSYKVKFNAKLQIENYCKNLNLNYWEFIFSCIPYHGLNIDNTPICIEYSTRKFPVKLNLNCTFTITDELGKVIKSLPKPKDKFEQNSYDSFVKLKKDIKDLKKKSTDIVKRFYQYNGKLSYYHFVKTFIDNPILQSFSNSLIWAIFEEKDVTETFRYELDGTYLNPNEEEILIDKNAIVGLVVTEELDVETNLLWKKQLEDYEVKQPFNQIIL